MGSFSLYIELGSTIKKAFFIAYKIGTTTPSVDIKLNGILYNFNSSNQVSVLINNFETWAPDYSIHIIDITNDITPSTTSYTIEVPTQNNQPCVNCVYGSPYLIIMYENFSLPKVNEIIILNNKNTAISTQYNLSALNPIDTTKPIGMAIISDRLKDTIFNDGYFIKINNNPIGLIGGADNVNSLWSCGVKGHFYYQNNALFGLDDDTPDSLMGGSDGLADISNYMANNSTGFNFRVDYQNPNPPNYRTNFTLGFNLTYTTPCDTFTTTITANDTICLGDSVQLNATGGVQYAWFGAFGGLSDTSIANPMASPPQTTTYIVTIKNDSDCVKTEQVKIWVMQPAVIDSISTAATICGSSTGSITTYFNGNFNFTLLDSNLTIVSNNTTGVFTQLPQGNYILQSTTIVYGCTYNYYDTLNINYVNLTNAAFIRNPWQGKAPLTVNFTNISSHANQYVWLFPADTFYTQNLTYTFDSGGVYPVCLIAQNNYAYCTDTACYTFIVEGNTSVLIPNVFTPNSDGSNDVFTLQITDADLITNLEVAIYNRWGEKLYRYQNSQATATVSLWNGTTPKGKPAPEGTYFYVLTYTTTNDKTKSEKGSITLLR